MSRRKRYIKGRVYITSDATFGGARKKKRRVVSMGNDRNNMSVRKISSLYDKEGKKKKNLIPIEKYPDVRKESGVERKTQRHNYKGEPLREALMTKTNTRLNKWDMERISRGMPKKK